MYCFWYGGYLPDEWEDTDWFDEDGNYHDISELGGLRKEPVQVDEDDPELIPF